MANTAKFGLKYAESDKKKYIFKTIYEFIFNAKFQIVIYAYRKKS